MIIVTPRNFWIYSYFVVLQVIINMVKIAVHQLPVVLVLVGEVLSCSYFLSVLCSEAEKLSKSIKPIYQKRKRSSELNSLSLLFLLGSEFNIDPFFLYDLFLNPRVLTFIFSFFGKSRVGICKF